MNNSHILKHLIWVAFLLFSFTSNAQVSSYLWIDIDENDIPVDGTKIINPSRYRTVKLDLELLDEILLTAPTEVIGQSINSNMRLSIPNPDGGISDFNVYYSPIMEEPLANMFPEIRTYGGFDIDGDFR